MSQPASQRKQVQAPEAPRGRPKSRSKHRAITEAAVELFLDRGFDGTSMDEIAERAQVSKQTVYSHFNSKEELFTHCIEQKCVSYELAAEFFDLDRPVAPMLRRIAHKFAQMLMAPEVVRVERILCASAEHSRDLSDLYVQAGPRHMIDCLAGYLAAQTERGALAVADPRSAACQLLFMLHGEAHMCALLNVSERPSEAELEAYVDGCVETFLRAFGPGGGRRLGAT